MGRAELSQLAERHLLELVVVDFPDGQQRQKVRVRMGEATMRGIRLLLQIQRPLARILDTEGRRNNQHLAQGLLVPCLQNHPAHRRIHRQMRQLAADVR